MAPLKEKNYFSLYISEPRNQNFNDMNEYMEHLQKIQKEVKIICPSCKEIFDKIFKLRLENLSDLTNELTNTYNLPSKEKNNEREKK